MLTPLASEQAALLACGDGSLLSHATAAFLWGLLDTHPATLDVTLTAGRCRPKEAVRLHLTSQLDPRDIRQKQGLRLTSPARTLVDLAAHVDPDELERLVAEARVKSLIKPGELEAVSERAGRRRGTAQIRTFLQTEGQPALTRSAAERLMQRLLRDAQLPTPRLNAQVGRWSVDFLWESEKVIVELDGFAFHSHRRAFERDRRKDRELADAGYQVIRITWRQLVHEPLAMIAHIARALDRRRQVAG